MEPTNGFFVYSYGHDDDGQGWTAIQSLRPIDHEGEQSSFDDAFIETLSSTLKQCGWEGDGKLGGMMVPPFLTTRSITNWFPVFHVKQSNNGLSWIASEEPLSATSLTEEKPEK